MISLGCMIPGIRDVSNATDGADVTYLTDGLLLEERARAVIAAGRPHANENCTNLNPPTCPCPQCAAWDALRELLRVEDAA